MAMLNNQRVCYINNSIKIPLKVHEKSHSKSTKYTIPWVYVIIIIIILHYHYHYHYYQYSSIIIIINTLNIL